MQTGSCSLKKKETKKIDASRPYQFSSSASHWHWVRWSGIGSYSAAAAAEACFPGSWGAIASSANSSSTAAAVIWFDSLKGFGCSKRATGCSLVDWIKAVCALLLQDCASAHHCRRITR